MQNSDITIKKQRLRAYFKQKRLDLSLESKELLDSAICANIVELEAIKKAKTILMFYPVKLEPDIIPIINNLRISGKKTAFPISNSDDCTLSFKYVNDISDMVTGTYNIPEPSKEAPVVRDFSNCVCLVPALAFDKYGYRIGYGKGYYDRFLKNFAGISIGIIYSEFITDYLPSEETDLAVDIMITERGAVIPYEAKGKKHKEVQEYK